jgi:hypothetical protein
MLSKGKILSFMIKDKSMEEGLLKFKNNMIAL